MRKLNKLLFRPLLMAMITFLAINVVQAQTTWTVNPDGSGYYTSIQAALNNATSGDVIDIAAGTYNPTGTFNLNIEITVQSAGQSHTIIDISGFDGYGFRISADNVTLKDFMPQGDETVNQQYYYTTHLWQFLT